jgi:maltooligosyltrehalose trehalohydrolase
MSHEEHPGMAMTTQRRLPVGAEPQPGGGVHFRVWAPDRRRVELVLEAPEPMAIPLEPEPGGYHSALIESAAPGARYRFRLDGAGPYPDPASRFQPKGPHGPSEVIDPDGFAWSDAGWEGPRASGQVLYEVHIGTFTEAGTWEAAANELPALAELGITTIELMPVADFPGRFGWGYDGVNFFAPSRLYGRPDDMRRFVDEAHRLGLGVILDVVYNHFGPDGNYLPEFSPHYASDGHKTDWGKPPNFDGEHSAPVRDFALANVRYWISEFHLDGLRVDATQDTHDDSPEHILAAITRTARETAAEAGRRVLLVAENEPQDRRILETAEQGGFGFDMAWEDDFHHAAIVALTGNIHAYYADYRGIPQEFVSALKYGWLYQGQWNPRQGKRRGSAPTQREPSRFINYLQNHDQLANSLGGERLHRLCGPGQYRAMTALWLLAPQTPMFFQGQEFASSRPFLYFMDHNPDLAEAVRRGHDEFLMQFEDLAQPEIRERLPDPGDPATFTRSKLDQTERVRHAREYALHRDLLRLRREDPALRGSVDGAVLGPEAFAIRYSGHGDDDRMLLVNFGRALRLEALAEPLVAPPHATCWKILWSSQAPEYGGTGCPPLETEGGWHIPGHAAILLQPCPENDESGTEEETHNAR